MVLCVRIVVSVVFKDYTTYTFQVYGPMYFWVNGNMWCMMLWAWCPNAYVIVLLCWCVIYVTYYFIFIIVFTLGQSLTIIFKVCGLKVLEHDKEQLSYAEHIWMQFCVYDRETWSGGAYSSEHLKGLHEDWVFGYDALELDDASMYV